MIEMRRKGTPFVFYHYMLDLEHGPCIYKRISGCGSGTEYMAVTPTGELYPCHQFVGEERFKMGDIFGGVSEEGKKIRDEFRRCNAYSKPECDDCWARLYCSGGCILTDATSSAAAWSARSPSKLPKPSTKHNNTISVIPCSSARDIPSNARYLHPNARYLRQNAQYFHLNAWYLISSGIGGLSPPIFHFSAHPVRQEIGKGL